MTILFQDDDDNVPSPGIATHRPVTIPLADPLAALRAMRPEVRIQRTTTPTAWLIPPQGRSRVPCWIPACWQPVRKPGVALSR